jgi:hypothetical protein
MELVTPGQTITSEPGFLRGHGTYVLNGSLIASVAGVVQRVNKVGMESLLCGSFPQSIHACVFVPILTMMSASLNLRSSSRSSQSRVDMVDRSATW